MKTISGMAFAMSFALCGAATQAQTLSAWLPTSAQVTPVLLASPGVLAARHKRDAQLQRAAVVENGSGEWMLRMSQQQRLIRNPQERYVESALAIERPVRLWGKSGMDAQLATQDREVARIAFADALHESSRQLLSQWFVALRAKQGLDSARREQGLAQALHKQSGVRLKLGDISVLDAKLASAELQRSEANVALAQAEWKRSVAVLQRLYPGLPEPSAPAAGNTALKLPEASPDAALSDFLTHHHELNLLRAESMRQQQLAARIERDRYPDPTVGVFTARERAGAEQLVGVSISVPLSGSNRTLQAQAALAEANALQARVRELEQKIGAEFESRWQQLAQQQQALESMQAASATQRLAADKSLTAYTLGEHSMTELIQNRRLANEQEAAQQRLRLDFMFNLAMLELDAHRLWDLDD